MILTITRQQTETIFKVCNLLDCYYESKRQMPFIYHEFKVEGNAIVTISEPIGNGVCGASCNLIKDYHTIYFDTFPTFEQLKPILDLIPVI